MQARGNATLEDLRHVREKAELVNGEIVRMTPVGGYHSFASGEIVNPSEYRRGELARAEPALPGWSMAVADLFPSERH